MDPSRFFGETTKWKTNEKSIEYYSDPSGAMEKVAAETVDRKKIVVQYESDPIEKRI